MWELRWDSTCSRSIGRQFPPYHLVVSILFSPNVMRSNIFTLVFTHIVAIERGGQSDPFTATRAFRHSDSHVGINKAASKHADDEFARRTGTAISICPVSPSLAWFVSSIMQFTFTQHNSKTPHLIQVVLHTRNDDPSRRRHRTKTGASS
jgi:hypothetical protein